MSLKLLLFSHIHVDFKFDILEKKLDQTNLEMVKPKYRYTYSVTDYVDLEKSSMSQKFRRLFTIALLRPGVQVA